MQIKQSSAPRWHAITPWRSGGGGGGRPAAAANPSRSLLLDRFIKGEPAALTLAVALFVSNISRCISSERPPPSPGSNLHTNAGSLFPRSEED